MELFLKHLGELNSMKYFITALTSHSYAYLRKFLSFLFTVYKNSEERSIIEAINIINNKLTCADPFKPRDTRNKHLHYLKFVREDG